jgi:cellulose synthase/poly-beta-1,6-N-acetylglucosamine synthase-like glycosyltransferase
VVVDDASTDHTPAVADTAGAVVISLAEPSGPYVARNAGWRATDASIVVFTDMRCRPEPGWLDHLLAAFEDPGVAVAGGEVTTVPGSTVAERWAAQQQWLGLSRHVEDPYYLPYVTTANMAVRRSALEAVDGFAGIRSGGDVDLCWRIQDAGLGSVRAVYDARMTSTSRSGVRDIVRQWHRFAYGHLELYLRHPNRGEPPRPMSRIAQTRFAIRAIGRVLLRPRGDRRIKALDELRSVVYNRAYRKAWTAATGSGGVPGASS